MKPLGWKFNFNFFYFFLLSHAFSRPTLLIKGKKVLTAFSYDSYYLSQDPAFFGTLRARGGWIPQSPPPPLRFFWKLVERILYMHLCYHNIFYQLYIVLRVLGLKKASTFDLFKKNVKPKSSFWIFSKKNPSEMNSNHPFYP